MGALLALSRSGSGDARDLPLQYSTSLQLSPPGRSSPSVDLQPFTAHRPTDGATHAHIP
jgi:hypothetical protein